MLTTGHYLTVTERQRFQLHELAQRLSESKVKALSCAPDRDILIRKSSGMFPKRTIPTFGFDFQNDPTREMTNGKYYE